MANKNRALVEKVNLVKRHSRPSNQNPKGGIVEKESPIYMSLLMPVCSKCNSAVRPKRKTLEKASRIDQSSVPCQWFRSKENQVRFVRNLRILKELDYEPPPGHVGEERREIAQHLRSLTLFVFSGDERFIDDLQCQIRSREHDIIERYGKNELHGILTHLKEVHPVETEKMFQHFMESRGFSKLKLLAKNWIVDVPKLQ
jgi:ribosomal protein L24